VRVMATRVWGSYLEWEDVREDAFVKVMGAEKGRGSGTADFVVRELESHSEEKAYLGSSLSESVNTFLIC
jgi:hypothetical protein